MKKTKILVPLDGTERSMHSLNWLKNFFNKDDIEITLIHVRELLLTNDIVFSNQFEYLADESELILDTAIKELDGYIVKKFSICGYAGTEILKKTEEENYDIIIMTKSSRKGLPRIVVGSVTSKVIKHALIPVLIIPE